MAKKTISPRVAQFIEMCDFPCKKEELLLTADECQFPDDVINVCEELPNKTYESEQDVTDAVEQVAEALAPRRSQGSSRRSE